MFHQAAKNTIFPSFLSLRSKDRMMVMDRVKIMAIANLTPDSFYSGSRLSKAESIERVHHWIQAGADIIDLGGQSTRPGAETISADEEWKRIEYMLKNLRDQYPNLWISIDTFYPEVAEKALEAGADIINDVSGGDVDMYKLCATYQVPYVLMHTKGSPLEMQRLAVYDDLIPEILQFLTEKIHTCSKAGLTELIIDPGFGFAKTIDHNYELLARLSEFSAFQKPVLAGLSRKSMVYRLLKQTPEEALPGTLVVQTLAFIQGIHILRVHDVEEAVMMRLICEKFDSFRNL